MHQHRFVKEAERAVGPAGGPATGSRAEQLRYEWVREQLTERGRERARALGWSDTYTLSKAIGERAPDRRRARATSRSSGRRSSSPPCTTPYPGWMESLKVADPILLGYGAGLIPGRFAANRSIRMDLIPVDFVANACLVAAAHPPEDGTMRTMNVSTGMRNPFTIHDMAVITTRYFRERPLPGRGRAAGRRCRSGGCRRAPRSSPRSTARPALLEKGRERRRPLPDPAQRRRRAAAAQGPAQGRPAAPPERDLLALRRARLRLRRPQHARAARRAAPRRPRALQLRRRRDRLGPLPRRGPPAGAARDRRPARGRPEEDALAGPQARAGGPARAGDLRRRGRRARLDRRALLRLAAHARHARAGQARVDRRRGDQGARLDHGGPALAHRVQPQLLPALQGPAGARAARARRARRCRTSSSPGSSTRPSAGSASTSAAATR